MELRIDERRLVELALRLVSTPSFTGSEQALAELMQAELAELVAHQLGRLLLRPRERRRRDEP